MSERSIAEIMGWEPAPSEWGYGPGVCQHPSGGYVVTADKFVTPDDMLAWLHRHCPVSWDFGGRPGSYWVHAHDQPTEGHDTLSAALEAAVRAVAEDVA